MPILRRAARTANELAEAPLLFRVLGERLCELRSAAVFFSGEGWLALALAKRLPSVCVNAFELRQRAVNRARRRALEAELGERAIFARIDPRIAAYGTHNLVVVRYPVSGVADCEGALRAAARASPLLAVLERPALAGHVLRSALGLGLDARTSARAATRGPVLLLFERR